MKYSQFGESTDITYRKSQWIVNVSGQDAVFDDDNLPDAIMITLNIIGTPLGIKLRDNDSFNDVYLLGGIIYPCKFKALRGNSGASSGEVLALWL